MVINVSALPSDFLASSRAFKPLVAICLWIVFIHVLFYLGKGPCLCHKYKLLIMSISFEPRLSTFFFTSILPMLLTTLRVLSVDSISRSNFILPVSGTITWSTEPLGIIILKCWPGYAKLVVLTLAICSLLPLKANYVLCSIMGSNSQ